MTPIEFIGFIISLAAMVFLFFKRMREEYNRRQNPQEYAENEQRKERALKELLKSMHIELEEEPEEHEPLPQIPPPRLKPHRQQELQKSKSLSMDKYKFKTSFEEQHVTSVEKHLQQTKKADRYRDDFEERMLSSQFRGKNVDDDYFVDRQINESRGGKLIQKLHSRRDMLIYKEIFGVPKALRDPRDVL